MDRRVARGRWFLLITQLMGWGAADSLFPAHPLSSPVLPPLASGLAKQEKLLTDERKWEIQLHQESQGDEDSAKKKKEREKQREKLCCG